jgi:HD-GYP domain-containing protein (c-di-GMP phosphodiesterase class II)
MADSVPKSFSEEEFLAVPVSSLIHRKASLSDLFIRLSTNRMVKVAHKGGSIDVERIERFGEKNVQYLYVHRADFAGIVSDLVRGAEHLTGLPQVPIDMKLAKFFNIAESVYTELLNLPISDESLGRAMRLSTEISNNLREKPDFAKLIKSVVSMGDEFSRHSLGSVVMSNLVVTQLDWSSPKLLAPVTMGAFFHDIGLKELPEELWFKNRLEMTKEELVLWETHPALGAQMLNSISFITPDVLRIVQEHHEVPNGTGFPAKLRLDRIFPMAKVVSLGNMLAHEMFDPAPGQPFSLERIAQKIDHVYSVMFGQDLARAARRIFKKDEK